MNRLLAAGLTAAAVFWGAVIVAAPFVLTHPVLAAPAAVAYAGASRICHQRPERSFHLHGSQMPVCARCSGIYLSAAAGALFALLPVRRGRLTAGRIALLVAAIPTAVTWTLEFTGAMAFSNVARAVAAVPLGAVAGWLFVRMLRYDARLDGDKIPGY